MSHDQTAGPDPFDGGCPADIAPGEIERAKAAHMANAAARIGLHIADPLTALREARRLSDADDALDKAIDRMLPAVLGTVDSATGSVSMDVPPVSPAVHAIGGGA